MKELKLTNEKAVKIQKALEVAGKVKGDAKFAMNVALNMFALKPVIESLKEAEAESDKFKEFSEKNQKLIQEYGKVRQIGEQQLFEISKEKLPEYEEKAEALKAKYKKAIEERESQLKSFDNIVMKSPANGGEPMKFHELPKELPSDLDGNTIFELIDLIEE